MHPLGRAGVGVVGGIMDRRLNGGFHHGRNVHQARGPLVPAQHGDRDRFFAETYGEVTVDTGFEQAHGMTRLSLGPDPLASDY